MGDPVPGDGRPSGRVRRGGTRPTLVPNRVNNVQY
jgi:hypothetical protein